MDADLMCMSTPKAPDTTAADEERQRQYEADQKREDDARIAREQEVDRQREQDRADQAAWEEEQRGIRTADERRRDEAANIRDAEERQAREQAAERSARVTDYQTSRSDREQSLRSQIDQAFAGYNDPYFKQFATDYAAGYKPQIEQQAAEARRKATLSLAGRGNLESTAGARALADIDGQRAAEEARLAREAQSAAANYRTDVLTQRRALLDQALSASVLGDPNLVPDDLVGALRDTDARIADFTPTIAKTAGSIAAPQGGSLGDLFSSLVPAAEAAPVANDPAGTATTGTGTQKKQASTTVVTDPKKSGAATPSALYAA